MIVLNYFGQQLEWVWAIVFVHGPSGPEDFFFQFWAKLQQWIMMMIFFLHCNQRLVNNESNFCDTKSFGAKLSVLNMCCQIVWCKNVWCQIILTSHYQGCQIVLLPICQSDTELSWPQIFVVLICLQSNHGGANCPGAILSWWQIVLVPYCLVLNCTGAKLSWCPIALVPKCPDAKSSGVKLSWCQIVWWQIVLLPNCMVPNCMVPNFPCTICDLQSEFSVHI